MQDGMRLVGIAQVIVERRERMRRREALLEQQPHWVAFVAEGRLHADEHVSELGAEHEDRLAVALLAAGRRPPLRLDLLQPAGAAHVGVRVDAGMHVGVGAEALGIAAENLVAQLVDGSRQRDRVSLRLQRLQRVEQRGEDG
jgi:hypothetical protein